MVPVGERQRTEGKEAIGRRPWAVYYGEYYIKAKFWAEKSEIEAWEISNIFRPPYLFCITLSKSNVSYIIYIILKDTTISYSIRWIVVIRIEFK